MTIDQAFNASIEYYDDWMKKALPGYSDIFKTAVDCVPFLSGNPIRVLDLGAGTGLFSQFILQSYPLASFTLVDVAEKMLDVARTRFQAETGQFQFEVSDYRNLEKKNDFDLIISSLSIHHLKDEEKRALFSKVFTSLQPSGVFINVDQVRPETREMRELYWHRWLHHVRQAGATEEQIQSSISRRNEYDKDASMSDQISWLQEAGFNSIDCVYKNYFVGVFLAFKGDYSILARLEEEV